MDASFHVGKGDPGALVGLTGGCDVDAAVAVEFRLDCKTDAEW